MKLRITVILEREIAIPSLLTPRVKPMIEEEIQLLISKSKLLELFVDNKIEIKVEEVK